MAMVVAVYATIAIARMPMGSLAAIGPRKAGQTTTAVLVIALGNLAPALTAMENRVQPIATGKPVLAAIAMGNRARVALAIVRRPVPQKGGTRGIGLAVSARHQSETAISAMMIPRIYGMSIVKIAIPMPRRNPVIESAEIQTQVDRRTMVLRQRVAIAAIAVRRPSRLVVIPSLA